MNMSAIGTIPADTAAKADRKPYTPPALTVFGNVAALTQSATGCASNDSAGCTVTPGSNMGPMA